MVYAVVSNSENVNKSETEVSLAKKNFRKPRCWRRSALILTSLQEVSDHNDLRRGEQHRIGHGIFVLVNTRQSQRLAKTLQGPITRPVCHPAE